jgi:hypothetical protein
MADTRAVQAALDSLAYTKGLVIQMIVDHDMRELFENWKAGDDDGQAQLAKDIAEMLESKFEYINDNKVCRISQAWKFVLFLLYSLPLPMQEHIENTISKEWWKLLKKHLEEAVEMCKEGTPNDGLAHMWDSCSV